MQSIRQIQELNRRELEAGISPSASWHSDYHDTAYIYIGGLPFELSEGDIITIFSQYGTPTYINLIRDKETGKSKGFAFLKYEDQRSTDLAVDNLGGAVVMERTLKVDHTRYKKKNEDEPDEGLDLTAENRIAAPEPTGEEDDEVKDRPMLREEKELAILMRDHDDEDPMKAFLIEEKKEEVTKALARLQDGKDEKSSRSKHRHHRSHRHREDDDDDRRRRHRTRRGSDDDAEPHRNGSKDRRDRSRRYEDSSHSRRTERDSRDEKGGHNHSRRDRDHSKGRSRSRTRSREDRDRPHKHKPADRRKEDKYGDYHRS